LTRLLPFKDRLLDLGFGLDNPALSIVLNDDTLGQDRPTDEEMRLI
jgi:hypothetical protein